jgi:hypothetical protein
VVESENIAAGVFRVAAVVHCSKPFEGRHSLPLRTVSGRVRLVCSTTIYSSSVLEGAASPWHSALRCLT